MGDFKEFIGVAGYIIEACGVLVIVIGSVLSTIRFLQYLRHVPGSTAYRGYRRSLGRSIILGLEFLIAGYIIRTVIIAATLSNVAILAVIVLIRSFLSLTLELEVEGRWPWQAPVEGKTP